MITFPLPLDQLPPFPLPLPLLRTRFSPMVSADTKLGMKTAGASTTIAAATKENRIIFVVQLKLQS